MKRLRKALPWIGSALSILLFTFLLQKLNFAKVGDTLHKANFLFIIPQLLLNMIGYSFRVWRWKMILLSRKRVTVRKVYGPMTIGFALNNLLPARAGELLRAYLVAKDYDLRASLVLGTILFEKIADTIILTLFLILGTFAVPQLAAAKNNSWLLLGAVGGIIVVLALAGVFAGPILEWTKRIPRVGPLLGRAVEQVQHFLGGFDAAAEVKFLAIIMVLSLVAWSFPVLALQFLLTGFHLHLPLLGTAFLLAATNLGLAIPAAPGGVGTFQAVVVYTLHFFNISPDAAFGFAVIWNTVELVSITSLGLFFLWKRGLSLRHLPISEVPPEESPLEESLPAGVDIS